MGEALANYLIANKVDIIKDIIIGLVCGLVFIQQSKNPQLTNNTLIPQATTYIKQIVINDYSKKNKYQTKQYYTYQTKEEDNSVLGVMIALGVVLTYLFIRFHSQLLNIYTTFTFVSLSLVVAAAIKLYKNNQYDQLNRIWTFQMLFIIAYNFVHISFMSKQDTTNISTKTLSDFLSSAGLAGITKFSYDALGFLINLLPNLMLILIITHMFAINFYLKSGGKFPLFVVKKTLRLTSKPYESTLFLIIICGLSLLLSSGVAFDFISSSIIQDYVFSPENK
ncbi:hypothetical protein U5N28_19210 [Lysinibacillus telephonicus]|uniref:hypothetical protein n=1 Tax=Lysinibacillus telephonicus TaxID=1714840 RepID=UPI00397AF17D